MRGGFLRHTLDGGFALLPLGLRVLRRLEAVVRAELEAAGALEMWLTAPADSDAAAASIAEIGHEHRGLPVLLYRLDAPPAKSRPRRGLGRLRDGLVVDAFAGAAEAMTLKSLDARLRSAQACALQALGLTPLAVGLGEHPGAVLLAPVDGGPDEALVCGACGAAASPEWAGCRPTFCAGEATGQPMQLVSTPGAKTVTALCEQLGLTPLRLIKTLVCRAGEAWVAALVRGDRQLSLGKLARAVRAKVRLAGAEEIGGLTGAAVGFSGPVGLPSFVRILADHEVCGMVNCVIGANLTDAHFMHVEVGRDFAPEGYLDLRLAMPGDDCAACEAGVLSSVRGIGLAESGPAGGDGAPGWLVLRHRLDLTGILAAVAEQHHDDGGIVWPHAVAPFEVTVLLLDPGVPHLADVANSIYERLRAIALDTLLDDRAIRAGGKFRDAELMGCPLTVVVGKRLSTEGLVEVHRRCDRTAVAVMPDEVETTVSRLLNAPAQELSE